MSGRKKSAPLSSQRSLSGGQGGARANKLFLAAFLESALWQALDHAGLRVVGEGDATTATLEGALPRPPPLPLPFLERALGGFSSNTLVQHLSRSLTRDGDQLARVREAITSQLGNAAVLAWCLKPLRLTVGGGGVGEGVSSSVAVAVGSPWSVARVLLSVDSVQSAAVDALLDAFVVEAGSGDDGDEALARSVLGALKWLDKVVDAPRLTAKLLECLAVPGSTALRKELITALPEIALEQEHAALVGELVAVLEADKEVTAAVLDALSRLVLAGEQQQRVLDTALALLPSARLDDVPLVLKYSLSAVDAAAARTVVSRIRRDLTMNAAAADVSGGATEALIVGACSALSSPLSPLPSLLSPPCR